MAIFTLDIAYSSDENDFYQTHELDGRRYQFRFTWNQRDAAWRISLYQPDGTQLALSRKIVIGESILKSEIDTRLPPGILIAVDTTGGELDPGHDDLLGRVLILYLDANFVATGQ